MFFSEFYTNILAFSLGFFIVTATIPPILRVAKIKKLFDPPDHRKVHTRKIPQLGGLAIFLGFIFSVIFALNDPGFISFKYIIAGVLLMLFTGLNDDLVGISALKKFSIQVLAVLILILPGNIYISNLHGLFGFFKINYFAGSLITFFILLSIVNAFNLIDGIDGLASGLGILASLIFGAWFFQAGFMNYAIVSFALAGSLGAFFLYNVFGRKHKLFMGDTGSLFVGLIIAILTVKFNQFNAVKTIPNAFSAPPVISFAIVIVPLIDVMRVMAIRILNGKSPFAADKNHIHHRLLELVPNHLAVTLIIIFANILVIFAAIYFNMLDFDITAQFISIFFVGVTLSFIPSFLTKQTLFKSLVFFK